MSKSNQMVPADYRVYEHKPLKEIMVVLYFSGMTKEWPAYIDEGGDTYRFAGQEFMPKEWAGTYAGHAKYLYCPEGRHKVAEANTGHIVKQPADSEMKKWLKDCVVAVEANRYEQHVLWAEWNDKDGCRVFSRTMKTDHVVSWEQDNSGYCPTVAYLAGQNIGVSLTRVKIAGKWALFWYACTNITDYSLIEEWLNDAMPYAVKLNGGKYLHRYDAGDFHNAVQSIKQAE